MNIIISCVQNLSSPLIDMSLRMVLNNIVILDILTLSPVLVFNITDTLRPGFLGVCVFDDP